MTGGLSKLPAFVAATLTVAPLPPPKLTGNTSGNAAPDVATDPVPDAVCAVWL
jgi:hypothetical protein